MNILKNIDSVTSLPALPDVMVKLVATLENPECDVMDLSRIILLDQVMSARTLKLANSAYYGMPRAVSTIKEAIVILGFSTVRQLALSVGASEFFRSKAAVFGLSGVSLWKHSAACALCSRAVSEYLELPEQEEIFTMSLLHDIGIVLILAKIGREYESVMRKSQEEKKELSEIEISVLGADHATVGCKLLSAWKLPEKITNVIRFHHTPVLLPEYLKITGSVVYLSDMICRYAKLGFDGEMNSKPVYPEVLHLLGLDRRKPDFPVPIIPESEHIRRITAILKRKVTEAKDFMEMV